MDSYSGKSVSDGLVEIVGCGVNSMHGVELDVNVWNECVHVRWISSKFGYPGNAVLILAPWPL